MTTPSDPTPEALAARSILDDVLEAHAAKWPYERIRQHVEVLLVARRMVIEAEARGRSGAPTPAPADTRNFKTRMTWHEAWCTECDRPAARTVGLGAGDCEQCDASNDAQICLACLTEAQAVLASVVATPAETAPVSEPCHACRGTRTVLVYGHEETCATCAPPAPTTPPLTIEDINDALERGRADRRACEDVARGIAAPTPAPPTEPTATPQTCPTCGLDPDDNTCPDPCHRMPTATAEAAFRLNDFHRANNERQHEAFAPPHSLMGLVACVSEEVGELAAAVLGVTGEKKRKAHLTNADVLDAVADAMTYLSLVASNVGCMDLEKLLAQTFNMVSDRAGSKIKVGAAAADIGRATATAEADAPQSVRAREALRLLREALADFAEADCVYGDNCPPGTRHGTCGGCKARAVLASVDTPKP